MRHDTYVVAYDDHGSGDPLMFIHGHPFNRSMWRPQVAALSGEFRTVAVDLPGYGESAPVSGTVTMQAFADSVVGLLDRLEIPAAVIVGLSMGGLVTMELGLRYPERVHGVILAATTAAPVGRGEVETRLSLAALVENRGTLALAADMIGTVFGPDAARDQDLVRAIFAMMLATNPAGAAAALRARAQRPDYSTLLASMFRPALVVAGAHDVHSPPQVIAQLVAALPGAEVETFERSGHLPNLEEPEHFNDVVREFAIRCFAQ